MTNPEPHETEHVAPLEWRRHFYDRTDAASLSLAVIFGIIAAATAGGAVLVATSQSTHPSVVVMTVGGAMVAAGFAATMLGVSGVIRSEKKRVTAKNGVTYIGARAALPLNMALALLWPGIIAVSIGVIAADRAGIIDFSSSRYFGPFLVYFALTILYSFWALAFLPMGRHLEFSHYGLAGQLGTHTLEIPWDSLADVSVYRGPSSQGPFGLGRRAEIVFTTTEEALLHEGADDVDEAPHPIGLLSFDVDEDTLLNVILAAVSHPEIRQLLGREEGTILFDGPPLDTRRAMSRSQVWLPWEQRIREAVGNRVVTERSGEGPHHASN